MRVVAPSGPGLAHEQELDGVEIVRYRYALPERETLAYTGTMAEQALAGPRGLLSLVGLLRAGVRGAILARLTRGRGDQIASIKAHDAGGAIGGCRRRRGGRRSSARRCRRL